MSMDILNDFGIGDVNFTTMMETLDQLYKNSYSITHLSDTTVPAIAIGSKIEISGAYYIANAEEAISLTDPVTSSTVANGVVYILCIAAGDTATAAFTATAPTWSDAKQGWYGTGGQANYKYLNYAMTKAVASYDDKYEFPLNNISSIGFLENGIIKSTGSLGNFQINGNSIITGTLQVIGTATMSGLTICSRGIRVESVAWASNVTEATVYDFISSRIPATISTSIEYLAYGHVGVSTNEILSVKRYSATVIRITYNGGSTKDYTDGDATQIGATTQIALPA